MRSSRSNGRLAGSAMLLFVLWLAACTAEAPASAPAGPAPPTPPPAQMGAGTGPQTVPEPDPNAIGGLPKEDLTATPKYGGTLTFAGGGLFRLDPHFPRSVGTERFPARLWASGLVMWDLKCNCPAPDLAESWQMAPDGLSYTFKLRKGVKFHNKPPVNGREVTIQDVKWSLDRATDLESKNPGKIPRMRANFLAVKEFQVVDDATLRIVMKQPDANIMRHLMYEYMVVLPKEAAINDSYEETKALIGSGPFMVELAQNTGANRYKKNPDYYEKGKPYLDAVVLLAGTTGATAQAAFRTRQVDITTFPMALVKPFIGDPQIRIYNTEGSAVGTGGWYFNVNNPPFNDVRVRRAFNLAVDRWEIYELIHDNGMYPWSMLGAWQPWHWSRQKLGSLPGFAKEEAKKKELEEAKKLLAEAGYASGLTVTCECEDPEQDELFVEQLKRVGVTVKINYVRENIQTTPQYMKDKQMSSDASGAGHTPDYALINSWICAAPNNMSNLCNDEIERLYKQQTAEFDDNKRIAILDKIQQRLWEIMPMAVLGRATSYHVSYKYVRGFRNQFMDAAFPNHGTNLINTWLDK